MDYGNLFRRSWDIIWQNKYLFILGFLAALGGGGTGNNFNFRFPSSSSSSSPTIPADAFAEFRDFWAQYDGMILGLLCFFFILGTVFWLIRLAAQGGLIESVNRIEAGEKMSFGKAFSAGVARIWSLLGLSVLLNLPFILVGLLFAGVGTSFLVTAVRSGDIAASSPPPALGLFFACAGLFACVLVPLGIVVAVVQPFAQRGLMLKQLGVVDSIRHGWQVVRENIGDVILLGISFLVIGFLFGFLTFVVTVPLAFLAAGPFILDAIRGNEIAFGVTEVLSLAFGGICLGLLAAAVNSALTTYRSATVTLAYQYFVEKQA